MRAAIIESFEHVPRIGDFAEPQAQGDEVVVTVAAAALSNLVKAQAAGKQFQRKTASMCAGQ